MRGVTVSDLVKALQRWAFQSTLPMRGVTDDFAESDVQEIISIHTPHAGSDCRSRVT